MSKRVYSIPAVRRRLLGFKAPRFISIEINFIENQQDISIAQKAKTNIFVKFFANLIQALSMVVVFLAILVGLTYFAPQAYYKVFPSEQVTLQAQIPGSVLGGDFNPPAGGEKVLEAAVSIPPKNENLPEGEWLIISRIGIRTNLIKTENPDEALDKGVWHVPGYGDAGSKDQPVILAAHRYGLKWMWEAVVDGETYALRNIFYKLPETEPGDIIEIISDQRRYVYEIYSGEENNEISDYSADLILYTCKYISSPTRLIRYARLLDLSKDTQK